MFRACVLDLSQRLGGNFGLRRVKIHDSIILVTTGVLQPNVGASR